MAPTRKPKSTETKTADTAPEPKSPAKKAAPDKPAAPAKKAAASGNDRQTPADKQGTAAKKGAPSKPQAPTGGKPKAAPATSEPTPLTSSEIAGPGSAAVLDKPVVPRHRANPPRNAFSGAKNPRLDRK